MNESNELILEQLYEQFIEETEAFIGRYKQREEEIEKIASEQAKKHFWEREP
tara:strand:- start:269 stop:424 length:156 start_codon:yes stop_codon:yes gene_type:complete